MWNEVFHEWRMLQVSATRWMDGWMDGRTDRQTGRQTHLPKSTPVSRSSVCCPAHSNLILFEYISTHVSISDGILGMKCWGRLVIVKRKRKRILYVTSLSSQSHSQSHIATDDQSVSKSWYRAPSGAHDKIFISVWRLRSCFRGAPSLTRGRVCLLYVPLALASAVFLGSESLGTCDRILLSQIWDFPYRRLLRLAGSRWRYSTPPPHGCLMSLQNPSTYLY
jgi:hypothetical protein